MKGNLGFMGFMEIQEEKRELQEEIVWLFSLTNLCWPYSISL